MTAPRPTEAEAREATGGLPEAPPCPFCDSGETELVSMFGSHASLATYWCRACNSPFERLRWSGEGRDAADVDPARGSGSAPST